MSGELIGNGTARRRGFRQHRGLILAARCLGWPRPGSTFVSIFNVTTPSRPRMDVQGTVR